MWISRRWWDARLALLVATLWLMALPVGAQAPYTLHIDSALTLVDLSATDRSSYLPIMTLTREDLRVFDNEQEVPLRSFERGPGPGVRPLAVWLVVQCPMQDYDLQGSGFLSGNAVALTSGLSHLRPEDSVGVAHWCDDGSSGIDRQPGRDLRGTILGLASILEDWKGRHPDVTRKGEVALETMLHAITEVSGATKPRPLPVFIFLHGDQTGTPKPEFLRCLKEILESSGAAYVLNDGSFATWEFTPGYLVGNVGHLLRELAEQTGGAELIVRQSHYGETLGAVIDRFHIRYQIGFVPTRLDGETHRVRVTLSDEAKVRYPALSLRFRLSYLAVSAAGKDAGKVVPSH